MQTFVIDNFSGKLTRNIHGDLNSGHMPFIALFGGVYPFGNLGYPSQLTFVREPVSFGGANLDGPILHWVNISNPANGTVAASIGVDLNGAVYIANPNIAGSPPADGDTLGVFINDVTYSSSAVTLYYNGGMSVGNLATTASATPVAFIGHDQGVSVSDSLAVLSATWANVSGSWVQNVPRPIENFLGKNYVGNGNNLGEISSGNSQTSAAKLSPGLPSNYTIRDLKVSNDGRYLVILASFLNDPQSTLKVSGISGTSGNQQLWGNMDSVVVLWNGIDTGYSSYQLFRGVNLSSIVVSNTETVVFGKDEEGVGLWDITGNKIVTIPETSNLSASYPPLPGQAYAQGRKIYFQIQYGVTLYLFCLNRDDNALYCLYYTAPGGEYVKGAVTIPSVHATNSSFTDYGRAKIYFGYSKIPISTQANNILYYQHLQAYGSGSGFDGTYSTQVQKFEKKVQVKEIRVYMNSTSSFDFSIALIDSNGSTITNSSKTFTAASGSSDTLAQGSLSMVRFNPICEPIHAFGVQITGGEQAINKVEIDVEFVKNPRNE